MINSMEHAKIVQARRKAQGKSGVSKAVRNFLKREAGITGSQGRAYHCGSVDKRTLRNAKYHALLKELP